MSSHKREGDAASLRALSKQMRRRILELSVSSKSGHIGSSMSCVELLACLYRSFLHLPSPTAIDRDRFLMSKGHACVPYYLALEDAGFLPSDVLAAYGEEGGALGHHPHKHPAWGIELSTGSLGHGLAVGAGIAHAAKLANKSYRTVVMMSDGEQNEGTVWEAATFAPQHKLDNLVAIVDFNKMQALGKSSEIASMEPLDERYRAFGWAVRRIDGHDVDAILATLAALPFEPGKPSAIIADTVKGKGVSFMEDSLLWHYRCPDPGEFAAAMKELGDA
jgi:transketolase